MLKKVRQGASKDMHACIMYMCLAPDPTQWTYVYACMEVRGQLVGNNTLLPPCGFWTQGQGLAVSALTQWAVLQPSPSFFPSFLPPFLPSFPSYLLLFSCAWVLCLRRSGKSVGSSRAGVTDSCEPPCGWWESSPRSSGRTVSALNHWAVSPASFLHGESKQSPHRLSPYTDHTQAQMMFFSQLA